MTHLTGTMRRYPRTREGFCRHARDAREASGMSREQAGELLGVTGRCLANYETDRNEWPAEVIVRMADVYGEPCLMPGYCQSMCPIGMYGPQMDLATGVADDLLEVHMYDSDRLERAIRELHDILRDGEITPDEEERFDAGHREIVERSVQLRQLIYSAAQVRAKLTTGVRR